MFGFSQTLMSLNRTACRSEPWMDEWGIKNGKKGLPNGLQKYFYMTEQHIEGQT